MSTITFLTVLIERRLLRLLGVVLLSAAMFIVLGWSTSVHAKSAGEKMDLNQPAGLLTSLMHKMCPEDLLVMTPLGEQTR